jgi:hypothetical protein
VMMSRSCDTGVGELEALTIAKHVSEGVAHVHDISVGHHPHSRHILRQMHLLIARRAQVSSDTQAQRVSETWNT